MVGWVYINFSGIDWNSVSAIVASLVFVAIILTLYEMKKQRSYTYRPMLFIGKKRFVVQENNSDVPVIWKESYEHVEETYANQFYPELANIGFAAAHSVRVEWIADTAKMRKDLEKYIITGEELTKIEYEDRTNYFFGDGPYGFFVRADDFIEEISFISREQKVELKLPEGIKDYLSFYPYLVYKNQPERRIKFDISIPISVKLEYLDLSKKKITQTFAVAIDVYMMGGFDKDKKNVLIGNIVFK